MSDFITKAILSGIGIASLTTEAIRKTAEDLVNQSKLSEEEGRRLVKEFQKRSKHAQKTMEKKVTDAVHKVFTELDPATIQSHFKAAKPKKKSSGKSRRGAGAPKSHGA
jgi:polyhydroxyalkanoate synthesis regulator phasin